MLIQVRNRLIGYAYSLAFAAGSVVRIVTMYNMCGLEPHPVVMLTYFRGLTSRVPQLARGHSVLALGIVAHS